MNRQKNSRAIPKTTREQVKLIVEVTVSFYFINAMDDRLGLAVPSKYA